MVEMTGPARRHGNECGAITLLQSRTAQNEYRNQSAFRLNAEFSVLIVVNRD
jgi:hypothetical protein